MDGFSDLGLAHWQKQKIQKYNNHHHSPFLFLCHLIAIFSIHTVSTFFISITRFCHFKIMYILYYMLLHKEGTFVINLALFFQMYMEKSRDKFRTIFHFTI